VNGLLERIGGVGVERFHDPRASVKIGVQRRKDSVLEK